MIYRSTSVSVQKCLPTYSQRRRRSSVPIRRGLQSPSLGHRVVLLHDYCAGRDGLQLRRSHLERERAGVLFEGSCRPPEVLRACRLGRVEGRDIAIGPARRSIASTLNNVWWIRTKGAACADIVAPLYCLAVIPLELVQ